MQVNDFRHLKYNINGACVNPLNFSVTISNSLSMKGVEQAFFANNSNNIANLIRVQNFRFFKALLRFEISL